MNKYEVTSKDARHKNGLVIKSKSSDWTDHELEVSEKDEVIHLKNPQLSFIFNDDTTPTPPPRKHKKSIREKIESVAKNSIQALQSKKTNEDTKAIEKEPKPMLAEEPVCVKKTIYYGCPCGNADSCSHKRTHKLEKPPEKEPSRKKNLSTSSLPTYTELKFSVANSDASTLKHIDSSVSTSANSLPGEVKKTTNAGGGKLENYMTRCRSFGSLLNNKLKSPKVPADNESDDSFGGLEDWDLGILEHYNPKDTSLPRPRKLKSEKDVISDIEKLIVPDEELEVTPPVRPLRRSESLLKKEIVEAAESRPSPSPQLTADDNTPLITSFPTHDENGKVEHSSLMRILQEYSVKDVAVRKWDENVRHLNDKNVTADFLTVEKESVS
ncbi:uncharacterized protein LOC116173432 isoform X3 [Photinus pyralis]|uniref:Uncharacterized protein n=3 Tax=Photinus pyralis TaxID=7054 RepID=A0A1Y1K421_PHOPY|nr:uncharacterized protein LOC116173432 isoform X3 [Photinus pyralis]